MASSGPELSPAELLRAPLYDVLGVPKTASSDDIKRAYRRMALKYHPDKARGSGDEATEVFQRIKFAFETLSDENKRALYDQYGERGVTMMDQAGPLAEFLNPEVLRMINVFFFSCTLLLIILLLFPIFLTLQTDKQVGWDWAAVFAPLWFLDLVVFIILLSLPTKLPEDDQHSDPEDNELGLDEEDRKRRRKERERQARSARTLGLLFHSLGIVFQILLVLKLDAKLGASWWIVFIPYWIIEIVNFAANILEFRNKKQLGIPKLAKETDDHGEPKLVYKMTPMTGADKVWTGWEQFRWQLLRVVLAILICLKADGAIAVSWAVVFIPLYLPGILEAINLVILRIRGPELDIPLGMEIPESAEREIKDAMSGLLSARIFAFVVGALFVYLLIGLLAAKLSGAGISTAVVLIPVWIILGLLVCCCALCLPAIVGVVKKQAEAELHGDEGPGGEVRTEPTRIVAADRRIEGRK